MFVLGCVSWGGALLGLLGSAYLRHTCWVKMGMSCVQVVGGEEEEEEEEDSSLFSEKKGEGG